MPTNEFLAIAASEGANVKTQAEYAALAALLNNGFSAGVVESAVVNKVLRQSSAIAALVAQYMADMSGDNVLDDGDAAALLLTLKKAIAAQVTAASRAVILDDAAFAPGVVDGNVVRWDNANSRYDKAVADSTANNRAVGVADVTHSKVYALGPATLFAGLTPGAKYFLSSSAAGALVAEAPSDAICIGIAKTANTLFVDVDTGTGSGATGGGGDKVFYLNDSIITSDFTIPAGQNAFSAGPLELAHPGIEIDFEPGATWTIG